jgi:hypothetical protein
VYTDHSRNLALITRDKFREWTEAWATGFTDARITNPEYIDAGDIVIAQFTAEGTNDGTFGGLKPTAAACLCRSVKYASSISRDGLCRAAATTTNTRSSLNSGTSNRLQRQPRVDQPTLTRGALGARLFHLVATHRKIRDPTTQTPCTGA